MANEKTGTVQGIKNSLPSETSQNVHHVVMSGLAVENRKSVNGDVTLNTTLADTSL